MNPSLTAAASEQLQEGINLVLSRWAALRMAIENEWGGRDSLQKSDELGHQLFHRLTQSNEQVYIDDLEDMLDEFMLDLNTEIGDGSVEEVYRFDSWGGCVLSASFEQLSPLLVVDNFFLSLLVMNQTWSLRHGRFLLTLSVLNVVSA